MLQLIAVVFGPAGMVWVMLNGLKTDVKETRVDVRKLVERDAKQSTDIAVHDQRIVSLESRIKKMEP